jgi:hypothetical protein
MIQILIIRHNSNDYSFGIFGDLMADFCKDKSDHFKNMTDAQKGNSNSPAFKKYQELSGQCTKQSQQNSLMNKICAENSLFRTTVWPEIVYPVCDSVGRRELRKAAEQGEK